MIEFRQGGIFESGAEALVNPVNCVGVMGKGLALQFKKQYPDNFRFYAAACKSGNVRTGQVFVFEKDEKYIINFPTKQHWRDPSRIEYIKSGLQDLAEAVRVMGIKSVALPMLGCGLGGLNWVEVKPLIVDALQNIESQIIVFEREL